MALVTVPTPLDKEPLPLEGEGRDVRISIGVDGGGERGTSVCDKGRVYEGIKKGVGEKWGY